MIYYIILYSTVIFCSLCLFPFSFSHAVRRISKMLTIQLTNFIAEMGTTIIIRRRMKSQQQQQLLRQQQLARNYFYRNKMNRMKIC